MVAVGVVDLHMDARVSTRFETWVKQWRIGWAGVRGQAWLGAIGKLLGDRSEEWGVYALRQGLPEHAEIANAKIMGAFRGIEPGPLLTDAEAAKLVRCARSLNRFRGTPLGLALALYYADFHDFVIVQQNGLAWYIVGTPDLDDLEAAEAGTAPSWFIKATAANQNPNIPAASGRTSTAAVAHHTVPWYSLTGGPMDADGDQFVARFGILFPSGVSPLGSDLATAANLDRIRRIIRDWRPAKAKCIGIYVADSGHLWGWGATWGDEVWGAVSGTYYSAE